ncbi:TIGR04222 domain-containing membrane protein [Streptomyces sp. NPDC002004]
MFWLPLLLIAWAAAGLSCARLCLAASRAAATDPGTDPGHELTVYEAAFLSGGPVRVADVTLVSMARRRRLLLAHTGWATVVDPEGHDAMECSVLDAIGPEGQARIAPVRTTAATATAIRALGDALVAAGLAVSDDARTNVGLAVRQVRAAAVAVLALGGVAVLMPGQVVQNTPGPVAAWFALPLVLTLSCLVIARWEAHPYSRWASPAGQRLLGRLPRRPGADDRSFLSAVAVGGVRATRDEVLRAAFAHRVQ